MLKRRIIAALTAALLGLVSCAGDGMTGETTASGTASETKAETIIPVRSVEILLEGDTVSCDDASVYVEEGKVTITSHGTYIVSGTWNDGQIEVNCIDAGEVNLVLSNAEITNSDQACIAFQKAQKATLTLADGSVNKLTDGAVYVYDNPTDDEPDAALYSKEDLVITGGGALYIDGNYKNGITGKDGLRIDGGVLDIVSVDHGIKGKDYLVINGGIVTVEALGDGLKSTNEESSLVGYIEMNGGTVTIYSDDEAIQAITTVTVNGGVLNIESTNNGIRCGGNLAVNGGEVHVEAEDTPLEAGDIIAADGAVFTVYGFPYQG